MRAISANYLIDSFTNLRNLTAGQRQKLSQNQEPHKCCYCVDTHATARMAN